MRDKIGKFEKWVYGMGATALLFLNSITYSDVNNHCGYLQSINPVAANHYAQEVKDLSPWLLALTNGGMRLAAERNLKLTQGHEPSCYLEGDEALNDAKQVILEHYNKTHPVSNPWEKQHEKFDWFMID